MEGLAATRCRIHPDREAVARCPTCGRFYCRECVTENAGRLACAACLRASPGGGPGGGGRWEIFASAAQACVGLTLLWLLFYGAGRLLILLPSSFHEGTLWGLK